jgi:hypothetical protein
MCASTETDVRESASDCTLASGEGLGRGGETSHPMSLKMLCPHPVNALHFPEAVTDKYKWIMDPFHADSPKNYDFSLEEGNYIDIISDTPLKVWFPRKSYIEFWVRIGEEVPHLSRKVVNNLLPFATSYLCKTGFSAVVTSKTKYHSISDHF